MISREWFVKSENDIGQPNSKEQAAKPDSKMIFWSIAVLLVITSFAKLWMLITDSFADVRVSIPKELLWLSVIVEFWLAYENFRIRNVKVFSFVNAFVFLAFGIFATCRWLLGYTSCGCSGTIELPVWLFVLIDFSIVAYFSCTSFQRSIVFSGFQELPKIWSAWTSQQRGRVVGLLLFMGLVLVWQLPFGTRLRSAILGESVIQSRVLIEDDLAVGKESKGNVQIVNRSSHSAKIIGISQSCKCFGINVPLTKSIPANGQISFPLSVIPSKSGPLHQRVVVFLDHPKQFRLNIDLFGSTQGE